MNFGKLLAAGKSWMNGSAEVAYRVDKQFYLPKFESPKNPFNKVGSSRCDDRTAQRAVPTTSAPSKKEIVAPKIEKVPANCSGAGILPTKNRLEACSTKPNWTTKLNPFLQRAPEMKKEQPIVQSELSLDSVKVVHNDLMDADVEIVPMKSRSAPQDLQPARKSWEILGERLLKATAL